MGKTRTSFKKGDERTSRIAGMGGRKSRKPTALIAENRNRLREDVEIAIYNYMDLPIKELEKLAKDKDLKTKDAIIVRILLGAHQQGMTANFDYVLQRTIGKVKDVQDVNVTSSHKTIVDMLKEDE